MKKHSLYNYDYKLPDDGKRGYGYRRYDREAYDAIMDALEKHIKEGKRVYVLIEDRGDYQGSIAYVKDPVVEKTYSSERSLYGTHFRWDKKPNKLKFRSPNVSRPMWLPDYEGPTVFKRIDKKAIQKQALAEVEVEDIDGNVLAVGDKVLYINARYGSGMCLERGIVDSFKGKAVDSYVDGKTQKVGVVQTIIKNEDGQTSTLNTTETMVLKQ